MKGVECMRLIKHTSILFLSIFCLLSGCINEEGTKGSGSKGEAKKLAKDLLQEKYEDEFVVYSIGNSWGTLTEDTFTALSYEKNSPTVRFEATVAKDGSYLIDEYIRRKISDEMEKRMLDVMQNSSFNIGLKVGPDIKIVDSNNTNMTVEEYMKLAPNLGFRFYVVTDAKNLSDNEARELVDVLSRSVQEYSNINGSMDLYFSSTSTLDQFNDYIKKNPNADSGMFEILEEANHEQHDITNSTLELTAEELLKTLRK
jgi:hypothetical protein